jgi:hypothetical protein
MVKLTRGVIFVSTKKVGRDYRLVQLESAEL